MVVRLSSRRCRRRRSGPTMSGIARRLFIRASWLWWRSGATARHDQSRDGEPHRAGAELTDELVGRNAMSSALDHRLAALEAVSRTANNFLLTLIRFIDPCVRVAELSFATALGLRFTREPTPPGTWCSGSRQPGATAPPTW